jgi:hypothetical protein
LRRRCRGSCGRELGLELDDSAFELLFGFLALVNLSCETVPLTLAVLQLISD